MPEKQKSLFEEIVEGFDLDLDEAEKTNDLKWHKEVSDKKARFIKEFGPKEPKDPVDPAPRSAKKKSFF